MAIINELNKNEETAILAGVILQGQSDTKIKEYLDGFFSLQILSPKTKSFVSAMKKLIKGKPLDNFNEEYSIECFWHELLHNYSKNTVILPQIIEKGGRDRIFMETVNQLVARNTYPEFLEKFGATPKFQNNILSNGFGYQINVMRLRDILKYTKIDERKFVENARKLLNDSYENFENKIKQLAVSMSGNPFILHLINLIETQY